MYDGVGTAPQRRSFFDDEREGVADPHGATAALQGVDAPETCLHFVAGKLFDRLAEALGKPPLLVGSRLFVMGVTCRFVQNCTLRRAPGTRTAIASAGATKSDSTSHFPTIGRREPIVTVCPLRARQKISTSLALYTRG